MNTRERKCLLETRLKNLKRKYAKMSQHADLMEEAIELKADIDNIKKQLAMMEQDVKQ